MIKTCTVCSIDKPLEEFKVCIARGYVWRMGRCRECTNACNRKRVGGHYKSINKINQRNYKLKLRKELQAAYGGACACCGEKTEEFLEIDHIEGGGRQHRITEKRDLYSVIKAEGYPKDKYRLLCSNCNHSLGVRGYCPHQTLKVVAA